MILQEGTDTDIYVAQGSKLLQEIKVGTHTVWSFPGIPDTEIWYTTESGNLIKPRYLKWISKNYQLGAWNVLELKGWSHIIPGIDDYGSGCFQGITDLRGIYLPGCYTSIGARAFQGCTGLQSFEFPVDLQEIGKFAFQGCTGLKFLVFTSTEPLEEYGLDCFLGIPEDIPVYVPHFYGTLYRKSALKNYFKNIQEL